MNLQYLLTSILYFVTYTEGLKRCFQCVNVTDPALCTSITLCWADEDCKVEQYISPAGTVLYSSGCISKTRCAALGKRTTEILNTPLRSAVLDTPVGSDILTCRECCAGEFCNNQGCGVAGPSRSARGPYCFNCNLLTEPGDCRIIKACSQDEVCMVYEEDAITSPTGHKLYSSICMSSNTCGTLSVSAVGRRDNKSHRQARDVCFRCCNQDFCNDRCQETLTQAPSAIPTTTTTTPSTMTTPQTTATTTIVRTTATTTMTSTTTLRPTTIDKAAHCSRHGYHYVTPPAICYKFHFEKKKWSDANHICRHEGGMLAVIDTSAKWTYFRFAIQHTSEYSNQRVFIGLSASTHHDGFHWTDGTALHFTNWDQGEPDQAGGDCVAIFTSSHYKWHDTDCNNHHMFVCTITM